MKSVMNNRTAVSLIGAAILVCAAYGLYHVLHSDGVQRTDDAYIRADSVLVAPRVAGVVTEVLVQDAEWLILAGLRPDRERDGVHSAAVPADRRPDDPVGDPDR